MTKPLLMNTVGIISSFCVTDQEMKSKHLTELLFCVFFRPGEESQMGSPERRALCFEIVQKASVFGAFWACKAGTEFRGQHMS